MRLCVCQEIPIGVDHRGEAVCASCADGRAFSVEDVCCYVCQGTQGLGITTNDTGPVCLCQSCENVHRLTYDSHVRYALQPMTPWDMAQWLARCA